jgi:hypothetical protein
VETHCVMPALLTEATMAGDHLCTGSLKHLRVCDGFLDSREHAEFCSDGNGQVLMQDVYCRVPVLDGMEKDRMGRLCTYPSCR